MSNSHVVWQNHSYPGRELRGECYLLVCPALTEMASSFFTCMSQSLDAGCSREGKVSREALKEQTAGYSQNVSLRKMNKTKRLTLVGVKKYYKAPVAKIVRHWRRHGQVDAGVGMDR